MSGSPEDLLAEVRDSVVELLKGVPVTPSSLRVRAGEVSVEVEWPVYGQAALQPLAEDLPTNGHAAESPEDVQYIGAPIVGTFYQSPEPGATPFVNLGDAVSRGQQVGIVEAMKMMIPVEADQDGEISKVLKTNGEQVEFGEALFALASTS